MIKKKDHYSQCSTKTNWGFYRDLKNFCQANGFVGFGGLNFIFFLTYFKWPNNSMYTKQLFTDKG